MSKNFIWVIVVLLVLVMTYSNFGRADGFTDSQFYLEYSEYFRGDVTKEDLDQPYNFRPVVPFLAALLPFDLNINFGIINVVAILLSCLILFRFLKKLKFNENESFLGVFLFVVSYPIYLFFPAVLTDAVGFLFLLLGIYLIFVDSDWFFLVVSIGVLVREVNAVLILIYLLKNWKFSKKLFLLLIPIGLMILMRLLFRGMGYYWKLSGFNLLRGLAYLHIVLGLGLLILFLIPFILKYKKCKRFLIKNKSFYFLRNSFFVLLLITIYAFISAYFDSRYVIVLYPALIPFCLSVVRSWKS